MPFILQSNVAAILLLNFLQNEHCKLSCQLRNALHNDFLDAQLRKHSGGFVGKETRLDKVCCDKGYTFTYTIDANVPCAAAVAEKNFYTVNIAET